MLLIYQLFEQLGHGFLYSNFQHINVRYFVDTNITSLKTLYKAKFYMPIQMVLAFPGRMV